jgi:hypothetical protein
MTDTGTTLEYIFTGHSPARCIIEQARKDQLWILMRNGPLVIAALTKDRRSGVDKRSEEEKRRVGERRSNIDRRSSEDRRSPVADTKKGD